jgi:myo-inositol-1(or 4)-monophosphatase
MGNKKEMNNMSHNKKKDFLSVAVLAVQRAGEFILNNMGNISSSDVDTKQASDFVTQVDRDSEQIIIKTIKDKFPEHCFLAEESIKKVETGEYRWYEPDGSYRWCAPSGTHRWIIDPLDGTTNYIHSYPSFSVSIALEYRGEIITGVIFDPLRKELFTAEKGNGAFLNRAPIKVSAVNELKKSLITTGFPFRKKECIDMYLKLFKNIFNRVSDIRRAGSAALDLAHLASGRCDGFFEIGLSPWDIAAGSLIIKEAGGVVTDFEGGEHYLSTGNIVSGTPAIHKEILKEVQGVFKGIIDR